MISVIYNIFNDLWMFFCIVNMHYLCGICMCSQSCVRKRLQCFNVLVESIYHHLPPCCWLRKKLKGFSKNWRKRNQLSQRSRWVLNPTSVCSRRNPLISFIGACNLFNMPDMFIITLPPAVCNINFHLHKNLSTNSHVPHLVSRLQWLSSIWPFCFNDSLGKDLFYFFCQYASKFLVL